MVSRPLKESSDGGEGSKSDRFSKIRGQRVVKSNRAECQTTTMAPVSDEDQRIAYLERAIDQETKRIHYLCRLIAEAYFTNLMLRGTTKSTKDL